MVRKGHLPYRVHIGGVGRIGTNVAISLHEAGVREITCNDPQKFEQEQLGVCSFSRDSDLGRPKVHVLERYLDGRPNLSFIPVVAWNQAPEVKPCIESADLIVSCANQLDARLYLEKAAIRLRKPIIQACAQDARHSLGGLISVWTPDANTSCFHCLFPGVNQRLKRGETLNPGVLKAIATVTADLALRILEGAKPNSNLFVVDMGCPSIDGLTVLPRSHCVTCGE